MNAGDSTTAGEGDRDFRLIGSVGEFADGQDVKRAGSKESGVNGAADALYGITYGVATV